MINVPNPELLGQICLDNFIYDPIQNPMDAVHSFFGYQDLQTHLKKLKQWKNKIITYDYLEISTVNNPIFEHKMLCNLLNAAWLLTQYPQPENALANLSTKAQEIFINKECLSANCYAKHLSTIELIDPYLGIHHFFESFTLQESHQLLYSWLNTAVSSNVMLDEELTIQFYKGLRRLIECCWLVDNRSQQVNLDTETLSFEPEKETPIGAHSSETIAPAVLSGFKQFLSVVPAKRLNSGLRKMLIDYLFYNMNGLPTDFEETLSDFYWLTDFLDEIQGKAVDPKFM